MNEQNELLEAALKLAESIKPYSLSEEERALIEVIEQHRTEPKRIEGWINLYHDSKPGGSIWPTEQEAKQNFGINGVRQVQAIQTHSGRTSRSSTHPLSRRR